MVMARALLYSCAMRPFLMKRTDAGRRGRPIGSRLLWVWLLAAGWTVAACHSEGGGKPGKEGAADSAAARPVPVVTTVARRQDLPIYLDGLGTVNANKIVTVRTQVDGRLDKVLFREGQRVTRGELLAQVDARPFLASLHQADSALMRDTALLDNARKNLERYSALRAQNLISQQQVDDQQTQVSQYEGAVGVDRAASEAAKLNVDYSRIVAPIDGVTGVRLVDEGNLVHPGDTSGIVVITQIDPIAVIFTLPEDDLPRLVSRMDPAQLGGSASASPGRPSPSPGAPSGGPSAKGLTVEAWSRDGGTQLGVGELTVLDNQINQGTATLRLKAVFANPRHQLWPNQFVKARLLLSLQRDALVVPAVAVQRGPKGTFIYVVGEDGTANPYPVDVELITGDQAVIAKGLQAGEQIVIEGQNQLRPGAKVAARGGKGAAGEGHHKVGDGNGGGPRKGQP